MQTIEKIASRLAVQLRCLLDEHFRTRLVRLPLGEQFPELGEFTRYQFQLQLEQR